MPYHHCVSSFFFSIKQFELGQFRNRASNTQQTIITLKQSQSSCTRLQCVAGITFSKVLPALRFMPDHRCDTGVSTYVGDGGILPGPLVCPLQQQALMLSYCTEMLSQRQVSNYDQQHSAPHTAPSPRSSEMRRVLNLQQKEHSGQDREIMNVKCWK